MTFLNEGSYLRPKTDGERKQIAWIRDRGPKFRAISYKYSIRATPLFLRGDVLTNY